MLKIVLAAVLAFAASASPPPQELHLTTEPSQIAEACSVSLPCAPGAEEADRDWWCIVFNIC